MLDKLRAKLAGKKTYLIGISGILAAVIKFVNDGDVGSLINAIFVCLGGMSIKAGVARDKK